MIEIAAFSADGAVGTADLVVVSSRFKIAILFCSLARLSP
jgi:hypothetical protein